VKKCLGIIKLVSKYSFSISEKQLMIIKTHNKNKTKCANGHEFDSKIKVRGKWFRNCSKCLAVSRKKSTKKYLEKKQIEKSAKFTVKF